MKRDLRRILCVDDEPDIRELICLTLETLGGYVVENCASGAKALEVATVSKPDLIILDVMMPDLDGPATLSALRSDARTRDIPTVFMTAKRMPSEIARLEALGACAVLPKPFDPQTLCSQLGDIWNAAMQNHAAADSAGPEPTAVASEVAVDAATAALAPRFAARAAELEGQLAALAKYADRAAVEHVRAIAHQLVGTGASFGHPGVSDAAYALEQAAEDALAHDVNMPEQLAEPLARLRETLRGVTPGDYEVA